MISDNKSIDNNSSTSKRIVTRYKQYLTLEKALSPNTVDAYLQDLSKLMDYLKIEQVNILDTTLDHLEQFVSGLHDVGIHPRSQARIISGIHSFFRFLFIEDMIESDPSETLESPRIGLHLPEVLTIEEIDRIITAVDLSKTEGQRNRAILETLYSCGLRVSELCNLKLSNLYFDEEFIRVEGKGQKERLVPISQRAIKEIRYYMLDRERINIKKGYEDYVFVSARLKRNFLES